MGYNLLLRILRTCSQELIQELLVRPHGTVRGSEGGGGEPSPSFQDGKSAAVLFLVTTSNRQSQYLASILHRFSSRVNRASKYQKKNKRDHGLEKNQKGFKF